MLENFFSMMLCDMIKVPLTKGESGIREQDREGWEGLMALLDTLKAES